MKLFGLVGGCIALALAQAGFGAVIFSDDFESYSAGPFIGTVNWTVSTDGGAGVDVTGNASALGGGAQGMTLTDVSNAFGGGTLPRLDFGLAPYPVASPLFVQFDLLHNSGVRNAGFQVRGGTGLNLHTANLSGEVQYNDGGGFSNLGTMLSDGQWYRFTISVDPANSATDRWDLRIQSLLDSSVDDSYANLDFQNNLGSFDSIRFHFNQNNNFGSVTSFTIDNFLVADSLADLNFATVPEPGTWVSFAILGLVVLGWRRRRPSSSQ